MFIQPYSALFVITNVSERSDIRYGFSNDTTERSSKIAVEWINEKMISTLDLEFNLLKIPKTFKLLKVRIIKKYYQLNDI